MKTYLQCPKCNTEIFTRIGLVLKGYPNYSLYEDRIPCSFARKDRSYEYWTLKDVIKRQMLLGGYCLCCKTEFDKGFFRKVLKMFKQKQLLWELQSASRKSTS